MSIEALWSVEFISNSGVFGADVAVFESGRIYGGDAGGCPAASHLLLRRVALMVVLPRQNNRK
ncbi:MAG: hypothetical protein ACK4R8_00640 [Thiobacillus sp.]